MAGEKKGKAYEAILKYCLDRLLIEGAINGEIYWDKKPPEMSIVPDLSVGGSSSLPDVIFLVTHSGAAKKSTMKMWRNVGELVEIKTTLASVPRVYSIVFESVIYAELKKFQEAAFDGQLMIGDCSYGKTIENWVETNSDNLPVQKEDKVEAISIFVSSDPVLRKAISRLITDLKLMLRNEQPGLKGLWEMERSRPTGRKIAARKTSFRRAISKLLIFESYPIAHELYWGEGCSKGDVPSYIFPLNLAKRKVGNAIGSDQDIASCAKLLEYEIVKNALALAPLEKMLPWILPLRHMHHFDVIIEYIQDNYDDICDPIKLADAFLELHKNPMALVELNRSVDGWPPKSVWLLGALVELIKAETGKASGFGYAQLGKEVVKAGFGTENDLTSSGQFGGGFGLSAWLVREPGSPFKKELVIGMAAVLAARLSRIEKSRLRKVLSTLPEHIATRIIEDRLCCYSGFDPLLALVKAVVPATNSVRVLSCFAEKAGLRRAGLMQVAKAKNTIINCQSATAAGRDHKKKELCGRAIALRYHWDGKQFVQRPGVKKLILLIDGTWTQDDINALVDAGWDEIFYPDEIEQLAKAIV